MTATATAPPASTSTLLRDVLAWDVITWSASLDWWRGHATVDLARSRALEVGAGESGGLSLWLALQGARVTCTSYDGISEQVRSLHRHYGVSDRIAYASLDALALDERERFDVIAFKSLLGGVGAGGSIARQQHAICRLHQALRPGGNLLFAENLAATRAHAAYRAKFGAGKDQWRYPTLREMRELLTPFSGAVCTTAGFLGTWGCRPAIRKASGAVDAWLCRRVIPPAWQYALFGVAFK